jgi:hypothetical protein
MQPYAIQGFNGFSILTSNPDKQAHSIISVAYIQGKRHVSTSLVARVDHTKIIIEHDINDKPLVDALLQAGIPREQIILAYASEPLPAEAQLALR